MSDQPLTSARARSSFFLGLLSFALSAFAGLPAVVQGVRGLAEVHRSRGRLKGRALALAGIGSGLLGTALSGYLVLAVAERVRDAADRMH